MALNEKERVGKDILAPLDSFSLIAATAKRLLASRPSGNHPIHTRITLLDRYLNNAQSAMSQTLRDTQSLDTLDSPIVTTNHPDIIQALKSAFIGPGAPYEKRSNFRLPDSQTVIKERTTMVTRMSGVFWQTTRFSTGREEHHLVGASHVGENLREQAKTQHAGKIIYRMVG
jgi:hypothetical protein